MFRRTTPWLPGSLSRCPAKDLNVGGQHMTSLLSHPYIDTNTSAHISCLTTQAPFVLFPSQPAQDSQGPRLPSLYQHTTLRPFISPTQEQPTPTNSSPNRNLKPLTKNNAPHPDATDSMDAQTTIPQQPAPAQVHSLHTAQPPASQPMSTPAPLPHTKTA